MAKKNLTLEEKVDAILDYQMTLKRYAKIKTIISVLTFFIAILIPILLFIWAGRYIQNVVGLTGQEIGELLRKAKTLTDFGGVEGLKGLFK